MQIARIEKSVFLNFLSTVKVIVHQMKTVGCEIWKVLHVYKLLNRMKVTREVSQANLSILFHYSNFEIILM